MSGTSGYIALALVGGAMVSLILVGAYFARGNDTNITPTGWSSNYNRSYNGVNNGLFGGRKTRNKNKNRKRKTRKA